VFDSLVRAFVKTVTRAPFPASSIAALKPAIPLPMTIKSVSKAITRNFERLLPKIQIPVLKNGSSKTKRSC
jgi:hypothetical protein